MKIYCIECVIIMLYFYLNFIECVLPCPLGYEPNSACNGCVPANICVTNDSCQNGGTCNIGSNNNVTVNTTACVANIIFSGQNCTGKNSCMLLHGIKHFIL